MAGADFSDYIAEIMRKTKAPIQPSLKSSINQKSIEVTNNDSNVIKSKKLTIQTDEGYDWTSVSKGDDAWCSKATEEQCNSEHEPEFEASDFSAESDENIIQVQKAFMAKTIEVLSEGSSDDASWKFTFLINLTYD